MNKKVLKLTAIILTLTAFVCLFPLSASADYWSGLEWDDYQTLKVLVFSFNNWGDMNMDKQVSITDAREVLKACAFEKDAYLERRDVNKDGRVSILDAKHILRYVAGLDAFRVNEELKVGEKFETCIAYDDQDCVWTCTVTPQTGLEITKKIWEVPEGTPAEILPAYWYAFTANAPGTYEAVFKFENSETHKIEKEIIYIFNVVE